MIALAAGNERALLIQVKCGPRNNANRAALGPKWHGRLGKVQVASGMQKEVH
jgi:hypothetical protein